MLRGARAAPRAVTVRRWPVPGCPVGAACPAFLGMTFSRETWQLLAPIPQGCFDPSFPPAFPLQPPQSRLLPVVASGGFQGVVLPFE